MTSERIVGLRDMTIDHHDILRPSQPRRYAAILTLAGIGTILAWQSILGGVLLTRILALVFAIGAVWLAVRIGQASAASLQLDEDGLSTNDGTLIVALDNIRRVERGPFAFKPSNGFLIVTKSPMRAAWNPGMWWRFGRRVGVGGVTSKADGKRVADRLTLLLKDRD